MEYYTVQYLSLSRTVFSAPIGTKPFSDFGGEEHISFGVTHYYSVGYCVGMLDSASI